MTRVIFWLMHVANRSPHLQTDFYGLKRTLLKRHAEFRGHDMQEITKECWGDKRNEYGELHGCGPHCSRCGGTGTFDRRWVRLERWQFGKYVFHVPTGDTRIKPDSVQIVGRIDHGGDGRDSMEAELWLYLVLGRFGLWWRAVSTSCYATPGFRPMCLMQKLFMPLRMKLERRRCYCGKRFMTWGTGWMQCRRCRKPKGSFSVNDDIPF